MGDRTSFPLPHISSYHEGSLLLSRRPRRNGGRAFALEKQKIGMAWVDVGVVGVDIDQVYATYC